MVLMAGGLGVSNGVPGGVRWVELGSEACRSLSVTKSPKLGGGSLEGPGLEDPAYRIPTTGGEVTVAVVEVDGVVVWLELDGSARL